jgi:hypothetical protein
MITHPIGVKNEWGNTSTPRTPSNRARGQLYLIFRDTKLKVGLCNGDAVRFLSGGKYILHQQFAIYVFLDTRCTALG